VGLVLTVLATSGIVAAALGVGGGRSAHGTRRSERLTARVGVVPSDLASSYRVLTSTSVLRRPGGMIRVSGVAGGKVVVSPGREVGAIGRERLWLVVGRSQSCLELDDGGGACGANGLIARQGVLTMLVPVSGAAPTVYGIVPDGATVSGRGARVMQSGNAYMVRPASHRPGDFIVRTGSGAMVTMTIPPATGQPQ
jgi:hypothetical protein